jgi:hypothetical protein
VIIVVRRVGIAIGSFVAAALVLLLFGGFIPQILGPSTNFVATFILGALIYRDIVRRDQPQPSAPANT